MPRRKSSRATALRACGRSTFSCLYSAIRHVTARRALASWRSNRRRTERRVSSNTVLRGPCSRSEGPKSSPRHTTCSRLGHNRDDADPGESIGGSLVGATPLTRKYFVFPALGGRIEAALNRRASAIAGVCWDMPRGTTLPWIVLNDATRLPARTLPRRGRGTPSGTASILTLDDAEASLDRLAWATRSRVAKVSSSR